MYALRHASLALVVALFAAACGEEAPTPAVDQSSAELIHALPLPSVSPARVFEGLHRVEISGVETGAAEDRPVRLGVDCVEVRCPDGEVCVDGRCAPFEPDRDAPATDIAC